MEKKYTSDYSEWNEVGKGSSGFDVGKVQTLLKKQGYDLAVDKVYGDQTAAAIKDYQQKNGLTADGIVGEQTWASLMGNRSNPTVTVAKDSPSFNYADFSYDDYKESDLVTQAKNALDAQLAQKPGAYQSQWQNQLNEVMDKILNREKFSYDLNGDALYQQYKDKYIQQGKMAMQDTMGQAAAMTGGYGNSYAASVGNQAYQASLQNLNDIVPELYQMAYDRYNQEGQDLLNQYGIVSDRENTDYGRYRDTMSDFYTERDYLANRYDSERSFDYSKYTDGRDFAYGKYSDDKSYAYNDHRNTIADQQWQANFDEAQRQYNASLAEQQRQHNETMAFNKAQANKPTVVKDDSPKLTAEEYNDVLLNAGEYASKGKTALKNYLNGLVSRGLSQDEAADIYEQYFPDVVGKSGGIKPGGVGGKVEHTLN